MLKGYALLYPRQHPEDSSEDQILINSLVGGDVSFSGSALVQHSNIQGKWLMGDNVVIYGIGGAEATPAEDSTFTISPDIAVYQIKFAYPLEAKSADQSQIDVWALFGLDDKLDSPISAGDEVSLPGLECTLPGDGLTLPIV